MLQLRSYLRAITEDHHHHQTHPVSKVIFRACPFSPSLTKCLTPCALSIFIPGRL
ncbi:uncharacterized protein BO96DRAFT_233289 [Aspergillus niger CBS 101883]|uniref:uncharacterized protein n=1 Tax=Aspergillus lacticoffeatus (strain CBS 101883) TaxID=1450533 RepID=UPI000D806073|nr:uncharacterized protein BO96DRAFT_233289 [Aspergillus niger CBS 101883]PYH59082.1 hypothetical protein BO96DRAFT_233289 [Aspergillus niger CBS 101883]